MVYFSSGLYPPNFSMSSMSSWFPPFSVHTFRSYVIDYVISPYSNSRFRYVIPFSACSCGWQRFFFWHAPYFMLLFKFLTSLFVSSGHIPSSALNVALLVVLEHPSIFLAAAICTVSSCFTDSIGGGGKNLALFAMGDWRPGEYVSTEQQIALWHSCFFCSIPLQCSSPVVVPVLYSARYKYAKTCFAVVTASLLTVLQ